MPCGPKKRRARRRSSIGAIGTRTSLDKESLSGSHVSDEGGTSPKTSDEVNSRLSVVTAASETPSDQTSFHTEEWVRISDFDVGTPTSTTAKSDFDVGTPTSTTAKSDYDAAAEDSYGDVPAQDKLVDWETVSRENAGNSSSAEDVGEAENVVAEYSSGSGQDHGKNLVDKVLSGSSDKEDDAKSVSSGSDGGKSSHSSSSSSSRSAAQSSAEFSNKLDNEERSSSIVVVPLHEDESQESSYAEVASVEARDDDYHGTVASTSSPEARGDESSAIEPVSSSDEQENENYEPFCGVQDQGTSIIEPITSEEEEEEEEKYRLFTDISNLKDTIEHEESSAALQGHYDKFSSFLSSHANEFESEAQDSSEVKDARTETSGMLEEEHVTQGQLEIEEHQTPEAKEVGTEAKESKEQGVEEARTKIHASDQNLQGGNTVEELSESIEPTTPEKASEKSGPENPYSFVRSNSDEELVFEPDRSSPSEGKQETALDPSENLVEVQDADKNIAEKFEDAPSFSSGIPEPDQHELNQLLEIAHSKELANLGKQEEKLLAQEEHDLGKGVVVETQPLVEVLSATDDNKLLEGGEMKDLQPVVAEEAPLLKDPPAPVVSGFELEAELRGRVPELFNKESEDELRKGTDDVGFGDEHASDQTFMADDTSSADWSLQMEQPLAGEAAGTKQQILEGKSSKGDSSSPSPSFSFDHALNLQIKELSTKKEDITLVPLSSLPDSEMPKSSAEFTKGIDVKEVEGNKPISTSLEKPEQVAIALHRKIEEQGRPSRTTSDIGGCCEPVQWLFANFTRRGNPRSI